MIKIQCSKCGNITNLCNLESDFNIVQYNKLHNFDIKFSYGSDFDGTCMKITICEQCLLDYIGTWKIVPKFKKYELM